MRVAVAQIEPKLAEPRRNLEACVARLEAAAAEGTVVLVLPELYGSLVETPVEDRHPATI